jgi:uncharacterized membrane protein
VIALLLLACADGGDSAEDTAGAEVSGTECDDAPVTTWENFGAGFVTENCQACHASTTHERFGAPADVTFDTEEETLAWADLVLARVAGDSPTMPPQGGVVEDDRYRVRIWLGCE